jgi:hypothetical protein
MTPPGLSQGRPVDPSSLRRVSEPLRWVLSPLDYRCMCWSTVTSPGAWSRRGAELCCRWSSPCTISHPVGHARRVR